MKWIGPITSVKFKGFDEFNLRDYLDAEGTPIYGTLLLKIKGKVVCICSLETTYRSKVIMCAYIEIGHALIVRKICRPSCFQKIFGHDFTPETMILKDWQSALPCV